MRLDGMNDEYEKVYYGIDTEIIFTQYNNLRLIGPTSTTTNGYFMFSNIINTLKHQCNNGLILRLSNDKYPYCFNQSYLDCVSAFIFVLFIK